MLKGKEIKQFMTNGDHVYSVREVEDIDYGVVYKIYGLPDAGDEWSEPFLVNTVYRFSALDVFIQNIQDGHYFEGLDI